MSNGKKFKKPHSIDVADGIVFDTIADVMHICFGDTRKDGFFQQGGCSYYLYDGRLAVWCPKMAVWKDGKRVRQSPDTNGWINVISDDGLTFTEIRDVQEAAKNGPIKCPAYTFGRFETTADHEAGYRFLGIFLLDENNSSSEKRIYHRISHQADLQQFLQQVLDCEEA